MTKLITLVLAALITASSFANARSPYECQDGYINSSGHCIERPTTFNDHGAATAKCRDGDYSYSEHHSGACSGHHGVARWFH